MKLFKNNSTKNTQLPITNPNNGPPNLNDINLPSTVEGELTNQTFPSTNINNNVDQRDIMFNRNKADTSSQGLVGGPRVGKGHHHFQPSHIYRHPFFLGTFVMGVVSWMTAFIGQCVTEGELNLVGNGPVVGVLWFAIWFQLAVMIHLLIALSLDSLALHRFQLAVLTAILVPFAVNGVQFIYQGEDRGGLEGSSALKAVGAGWMLLAMVDILWVLYLTSEEDSLLYGIFNMFGDGGLSSPNRNHRNTFASDRVIDLTSSERNNGELGNNVGYANGGGYTVAPQHGGTPVKSSKAAMAAAIAAERSTSPGDGMVGTSGGQDEQSFGARARALYAYTASPDDPNEVSFGKGEIIQIIDSSGKWWQCRTASGQVGIAPSNYLQLL